MTAGLVAVPSSGGIGGRSAACFGSAQPRAPGTERVHPGTTWHRRQVDYLRSVADEDRRNRYANGIEYVYGPAVRASIEAEVARLGPAKVMRKLRDYGGVRR